MPGADRNDENRANDKIGKHIKRDYQPSSQNSNLMPTKGEYSPRMVLKIKREQVDNTYGPRQVGLTFSGFDRGSRLGV
jgi:hypothetical protein